MSLRKSMPKFEVLVRQCAPLTFAILLSLSLQPVCHAQVSSASVSVTITDSTRALIPNADVGLRNSDTNQAQHSTSSKSGSVSFPFLKTGHYSLIISKEDFADVSVDNIELNVGDNKHYQVALKVGSSAQTVTVDASGLGINTTDASVSTIIDRKFVENIPLNGRSFQSLILLAPGTLSNSPQRSSSLGGSGEFSVNGQRTESNYYTVDGVSANSSSSSNVNAASPGSLPAATSLGTTQALVSVDALQEFRTTTSTYSAEYGRNPGGQFAMVTRSGTNDWHGSAYDYLRNNALDSNNWFNDHAVPITNKTAERQNDFGGTFGGPISIPLTYDGRNRTFFFFSYEGLRLTSPVASNINYVPTVALRQASAGALQQALNAFPLPSPNAPNLGNGLSEFIGGWSNPSQSDTTSLRLDQALGANTHIFFRYSGTPSSSETRGSSTGGSTPSTITSTTYRVESYTLGATTQIARNLTNDFRLNLTQNETSTFSKLDSFGGASPVDLTQLQNVPEQTSVVVLLNPQGYSTGLGFVNQSATQRQWNLVDTVVLEHGRHAIKVGIDWRRLTPTIAQPNVAEYQFSKPADIQANSVDVGIGESYGSAYPIYLNFSAFIQDEWKATKRLNLSVGLRWDVNPAPGVVRGLAPYTIAGLNDVSTMTLAPQGTPLWKTTWYNIAPRIGAAYRLNANPATETVFRAGAGVFFDTGQQTGTFGFQGPGFQAIKTFG